MGARRRRAPDVVLSDAAVPAMPRLSTQDYRGNSSARSSNAIVIDLGSNALRAGFSGAPDTVQSYPPLVARVRDPLRPHMRHAVGWDAMATPLRSAARPAYEAGIPTNGALVERLLDGTLVALGLSEEENIDHRFVLTEPPCQPNAARATFMEILFEGYCAPAVCFGIDALFSYLYNRHVSKGGGMQFGKRNSMVISCGHASTHVLPVVDGKYFAPASKRINVGGMHMTEHLAQRLRLLNTDNANVLSNSRVERLKEQLCYVSTNFDDELRQIWHCTETYEQALRIVKVPYLELSEKPQLSEEEQERVRQAKIENGRRLSEMMKEKRRAKSATAGNGDKKSSGSVEPEPVKFSEEEVAPLYDLLAKRYELQRIDQRQALDEDEFYMAMVLAGFEGREALVKALDEREDALALQRDKLGRGKADAAEAAWWKRVFEDELLSVTDSDLPAPLLKRKRQIKALRGAAEARIRAKKEKEAAAAAALAKEEALRKRREADPEGYLRELREERNALAEKIKRRAASRQAGSDRRSLASRERMRLIAEHAGRLGEEEEGGSSTRAKAGRSRRGRGRAGTPTTGGSKGVKKEGKARPPKGKKNGDDDFGMRDSDWDVYRDMQVRKSTEDSDDGDAADEEMLKNVRKRILELAPDEDDPTILKREGSALLFEPHPFSDEIPVVVDRLRVPEILFQPSLIGLEQCGLIEAMNTCVRSFAEDTRRSIVSEVFISGGVGSTRGLEERIKRELRSVFPMEWGTQIEKGVWKAKDSQLDAWKGAALFAEDGGQGFDDGCVFRKDYDEKGPDYIHEHLFGNTWVPTPFVDPSLLDPKKKKQKVGINNRRYF